MTAIEPGQVWRRKKDGVRIRIVKERDYGTGGRTDDWVWEHAENPKRVRQAYGYIIRRNYELEGQDTPAERLARAFHRHLERLAPTHPSAGPSTWDDLQPDEQELWRTAAEAVLTDGVVRTA